ncbi:MAG: UDP-N-acetylmuramate dehydrogenase [Candidatus Kerfeldbacteria bacterium]|nr:UDP-N-acetylmuramate dehydrogenase [Candidatus Kerfeldbacteria bacterium]
MSHLSQLPTLQRNVVLAPFTTMKVGGAALYFVAVSSSVELRDAARAAIADGIDYVMIGGGSNTVVSDKGFDGLVIKASGGNHEVDATTLTADSTCILAAVSRVAFQYGLSGLEYGVGIPGTVGGAIVGNAGNFLGDTARILETVDFLDDEGEEQQFSRAECEFDYRSSVFKKHLSWVILRAHFQLARDSGIHIEERMDEIITYKKNTQYGSFPTLGCMFKNIQIRSPQDRATAELHGIADLIRYSTDIGGDVIPVSVLLERLGLKGYELGGARISEKNANFVFNTGGATSEHIMTLVGVIQQKVRQEFGFELHEEFRYIGTKH